MSALRFAQDAEAAVAALNAQLQARTAIQKAESDQIGAIMQRIADKGGGVPTGDCDQKKLSQALKNINDRLDTIETLVKLHHQVLSRQMELPPGAGTSGVGPGSGPTMTPLLPEGWSAPQPQPQSPNPAPAPMPPAVSSYGTMPNLPTTPAVYLPQHSPITHSSSAQSAVQVIPAR
jgi:hypothetical protein